MTDEAGLLQAMRDAPGDSALRLVYADWLEEQGDPRADFVRLESRLRRSSARDAGYPRDLALWLVWRDRLPADWLEVLARRVNGLPLPAELLALIEAGRWRCPADQSAIDRLFPERSELCLYSFELMQSETKGFPVAATPMWLGEPDPAHPPGDIDPRLAVLVADLGIGYDQPIALDYRTSLGQPQVLTLQWGSSAQNNRWVEVDPNIQAFAETIGL
jgi:uncharacterized protein (TIGR02996 family)